MNIRVDSRVKIKCPNAAKYPAFAKAFVGRTGVIERFACGYTVAVIKLGDQTINVEANEKWLQHDKTR